MSEFVDAALSVPTVIFTVALVVAGLYWVATVVGGFDADGIDALDGAEGAADGVLDVLGLTTVPPAVALSLVVAFSWFASLTSHVLLHPSGVTGAAGALLAVVMVVGALVVGTLAASLLARPLARIYQTGSPNQLADFVGRTCVIRTGRVDHEFGQAEVTDDEGATLLIEVRCSGPDLLHRGDHALIYHFDPAGGLFEVTTAPALH